MEKFLKHIQENWSILGFIVVVIMTWTTFSNRLNAAEEDIKDLRAALAEISTIKEDVGVIKNDIGWIKNRLK